MPLPEFATRTTIWVAIVLYAGSYFAARWQIRRLLWSFACTAFEAHVLCAFAAFYHWSHDIALRETARQTAALTGPSWSGGIYLNYAMAGLWLADTAWWWGAPASYATRPRWLSIAWHGFLFFMVVNGAVVFNPSPTRWRGVCIIAALGAYWLYSTRRTRTAVP